MTGRILTATATLLLVILAPPPQVALPAGPPPQVAQAAAGLTSKDAVARATAGAQLGAMGEEAAPAVPLLVRLLSDEAEVFSGIGIRSLVLGNYTTVSAVAATALGKIGDKRAIEPLCALMLSKSRRVGWQARASAAGALGQIGDARAVPSLCLALSDPLIENNAEASLVKIGEPAVKPLVNATSTGTPGLCQKAFGVLGKIGKAAVPSLVNLMKPGKGEVARLAAHALGSTGDPDALAALCAALKDPKAGSRGDAVSGLNAFSNHLRQGKPPGEDKLRALVLALEGDAVDPVVAVFKDRFRPVETRKEAADVLQQSRNPLAVEPLVEAMADSNDQIRYAGFYGICDLCRYSILGRSWFEAEDPAGKEKWDKARTDLLEALKGGALRPLVKALGSKESQIQSGAQSALHNLTGQNFRTRAEWEAWLKEQEGK